MKKFSGYEETKIFTEERLPKGGYIIRILKVEEVIYSWGSVLKMDFDITEGEYKNFYQRNFEEQVQEQKKWKGSYRLPIPQDDGSKKDGWTKSRFKATMQAFEQSNPGFRWNWDEKQLIGKIVGGLFNEKEWEVEGRTGWYTQCKKLVTVKEIKEKTYTLPKDEPLKEKKPTISPEAEVNGFVSVEENEDDALPFN